MIKITQEYIKSILSYDKETGMFFWIKPTSTKMRVGSIAGAIDKSMNYVKIKINGKSYYAHRLAWLYVYGELPSDSIDHINHNGTDNRMCNLRLVSHLENMKNQKQRSTNSSGVIGVSWYSHTNKWRADITIDGQRVQLGYYVKFSDAVDARKNAEVLYGFHHNHGKELK